MPGYHSRLSASGSTRWMKCAASPRLIQKLKDLGIIEDSHSIYAAEGTAAHHLGELCLRNGFEADEFLGETIHVEEWEDQEGEKVFHTAFRKFKPGKRKLTQVYAYQFNVDDDMIAAVQVYLDFVGDILDTAELSGVDARLSVEVWCALDDLGIEGLEGGTSDTLIVFDNGEQGLHVVDYKHGQGHVVEAKWNSQLCCYVLGAVMEVEKKYGIKVPSVTYTIVQPRAYHPDGPIRTETIDREDLMAWRDLDLIPCAEATHDPEASFHPGESQCFYCPAAGGNCAAEIKYLEKESASDFKDFVEPEIEMVPISDLSAIVANEAHIKQFFSKARDRLLEKRKSGFEVPGWKLARSKKHRRLLDEAEDILFDYLPDEAVYREKLQTLGALEKALKKMYGKEKAKEVMNEITETPEGDIILVRDTDNRREEAATAQDDFAGYL